MTKAHIAGREPMPIAVEEGKSYWWCSCGQSKNQPFCDGSHKAEGVFNPVSWTAPKSGTKYFCTCKQTSASPFCDGTHKTLEA
jgi:CDGSH iron-sulfur domain-containing protein 3